MTGPDAFAGIPIRVGDQLFTADQLVQAGRVLRYLADDQQEEALKALRESRFEKARMLQLIADMLRDMDIEAILNKTVEGLSDGH